MWPVLSNKHGINEYIRTHKYIRTPYINVTCIKQ